MFKKTNFMVFTKKRCNTDISIYMCDCEIKQVTSLKFLGIIVDNKLNWTNHINFVCNKVSENIGIMYKLKSLPKSVLKLIYNTIVLPFFLDQPGSSYVSAWIKLCFSLDQVMFQRYYSFLFW